MPSISAVAYRSRAVAPWLDGGLHQLLVQARRHNRLAQLTGLLIVDRGHFYQWLEGPSERLASVWARIQVDRRHEAIDVLLLEEHRTRLFEGWEMQFGQREGEPDRIAGALIIGDELLDEVDAAPFLAPQLFAVCGRTGRPAGPRL